MFEGAVAELINQPVQMLIAFLTLTGLEIVLGIDNIVLIAILAGRLPQEQRERARILGLQVAVVSRLCLLFFMSWLAQLESELFSLLGHPFSGKDLVLILGGAFLIFKSTHEIHDKVEHGDEEAADGEQNLGKAVRRATLSMVLIQIMFIDIVFSLDSVITAVGMARNLLIMAAAVIASVAIMLLCSGYIVRFIDRNPAIKVLALAFLLMVGVLLVAEGFGQKIDKGYIYFGMAFSLGINMLQMRYESNQAKKLKVKGFAEGAGPDGSKGPESNTGNGTTGNETNGDSQPATANHAD